MTGSTSLPGYTYGQPDLARSPVSLEDLELLKQTVLMTDDDLDALRMSLPVLQDQTDAILDVWYGFVGSHAHLLHYFTNRDTGEPNGDYLSAVRARFAQWILDTARANYDQDWLNYQNEIGLRHHRVKKNVTDGAAAVAHINFRYLPALMYPVTTTLKPFLEKKGHTSEEVDRMHQAWIKSVLLQVILWSYPYIHEGDF